MRPQVRSVYPDEGGVLANARRDALLIDCSTIDVDTARVVASAAKEAGFDMLDAPVSGGMAGAESGEPDLYGRGRGRGLCPGPAGAGGEGPDDRPMPARPATVRRQRSAAT